MPNRFQEERIAMRKSVQGLSIIAAVTLAVLVLSTASVMAMDVSRGEFYSEEEYQDLSKDEAEAYCAALAEEQEEQKARLAEAESKLDREMAMIADLEAELKKVESQLQPLESKVSMLEKEIAELEALPTEWEVKEGENLYRISGYEQIYSDPTKWPRIYRANRDKIEDPTLIYPGWILNIPRGLPMTHMVVEGEWLARISGYWEIYDDWRHWTRIYEANKDKISDPDMIMPGWELDIPR
jgi:nucleoid-associated protein YgaU